MEIRTKIAAPSLGKTFGAVQWMRYYHFLDSNQSLTILICSGSSMKVSITPSLSDIDNLFIHTYGVHVVTVH
jgi:hypothetical protein